MRIGTQEIICLSIILISVVLSFRAVIKNSNLDEIIYSIISGTSTIITFLLMVTNYERVNLLVNNILQKLFPGSFKYYQIIHVIAVVIIFCLVKFLIQIILKLLHHLFSSGDRIYKKTLFMRVFSILFGIIRGLVIIVLFCISLVLYNNIVSEKNRISYFDGLTVYERVKDIIEQEKVQAAYDGESFSIATGKIVYYNGVTIEDAIESNSEIDNKAKKLTKRCTSDRERAKVIYTWVGENIEYDDDKAERIMNKAYSERSGTIVAYNERKGICFDYASLFTSMCKAIGLKSRIIIGDAYNGVEFVSHAWNMVYLADEDKWVKVDTVFYDGGDFFDSDIFDEYHIEKNVAGEF